MFYFGYLFANSPTMQVEVTAADASSLEFIFCPLPTDLKKKAQAL